MNNNERKKRRLYVASFLNDVPTLSRGELIPKRVIYTAPEKQAQLTTTVSVWYMRPAFLLTLSVLLFAVSIGTTGYSVLYGTQSAAAPILSVTKESELSHFRYGIALPGPEQVAYEETKDTLLKEVSIFMELDLIEMELRYYKDGEVVDRAKIHTKGESDTWWQIPAGLYTVDQKKKKRYSNFGNIYMPWSLSFDGNFYINGWPYYKDETLVPEEYMGGGARLFDEDAERIFEVTEIGTPVLVREYGFETDDFLYTASVEGVHAREYLIADVESNTILAASDMDAVLPIASLVKLMTALVAAEEIDLEKDVLLHNGTASWVTTIIPRLSGSYQVSMYSLLQLLLQESSNEAAEVIASEIGRTEFIELMNAKAKEIGMRNTTFADPSGLDDGNISSMHDLLVLVQYIHNNRGFILEMTREQNLPTAYTDEQFGGLVNFNMIDGVDFVAGKVGETAAAGQTSISLHSVSIDQQNRLIAVILLGTDERTKDIVRLISFVEEQFN